MQPAVSIIIPTLNEAGNIRPLIKRLDQALRLVPGGYEIVVIDDHSRDTTVRIARSLAKTYPVIVQRKHGVRGKAFSLLQGFAAARGQVLCMIDADLQYPPEAIPGMLQLLERGCDVVVADRDERQLDLKRRVASRTFKLLFGRLLHGLSCDVQSGLKVFRAEILEHITVNPTPWTFDLEFLVKARHVGYRVGSVEILFAPRTAGETKVNLLHSSWEIALSSLKVKLRLIREQLDRESVSEAV